MAVLAVLVGLSGGCSTINKGITESVLARKKLREWSIHYASRSLYTLTDKTLLEVEFEGSRNAGDTVVRYQRGLGDQAQCLADKTAALLEAVHQRTGVVLTTRSTHLPAALRPAAAGLHRQPHLRAERVSAASVHPGRPGVVRGDRGPEPQLPLSAGARAGGDLAGPKGGRLRSAGPGLGHARPDDARQQLHPLVSRRLRQLRRLYRL